MLEAFWSLHRQRPQGFGPAAIPLPAAESYLRLMAIDDAEDVALFMRALEAMDQTWLVWARERAGN